LSGRRRHSGQRDPRGPFRVRANAFRARVRNVEPRIHGARACVPRSFDFFIGGDLVEGRRRVDGVIEVGVVGCIGDARGLARLDVLTAVVGTGHRERAVVDGAPAYNDEPESSETKRRSVDGTNHNVYDNTP